MKILILCETSGALRERFFDKGDTVMSVDTLPADNPNHPSAAHHFQMDAVEMLSMFKDYSFDLIIGHPPCTAMAVSGNAWYGKGKSKASERAAALVWTKELWDLAKTKGKRVMFENPVSVLSQVLGKPQSIQPWQFGHPESKRTCFWLHNLPELSETNNVKEHFDTLPKKEQQRMHYLPPSADRWKIRSQTFSGIAKAIVSQWG
tara:strand:+ start:2666 stop:3277 length:612 start_codon:yes stop_codon:yes gene_type:complete